MIIALLPLSEDSGVRRFPNIFRRFVVVRVRNRARGRVAALIDSRKGVRTGSTSCPTPWTQAALLAELPNARVLRSET